MQHITRLAPCTNVFAIDGTLVSSSFWCCPDSSPNTPTAKNPFRHGLACSNLSLDGSDPSWRVIIHPDGFPDPSVLRGALSTGRRLLAGDSPQLPAAANVDTKIRIFRQHPRLDDFDAGGTLGLLPVDSAPIESDA